MKSLAIVTTIILFSFFSFSQETKLSTGEFTTKLSNDETLIQAQGRAKEKATINAMDKVFGTTVNQEANLNVVNGKSHYTVIGSTRVGGEVREEISCEYSFPSNTNGEIWVKCKIRVRVAPATPKADIQATTLTLPDAKAKSNVFNSGSEMYVYFKSPVDGFLSIYLDDFKDISKIFPYHEDFNNPGVFPVKADKEYILFTENIISDGVSGHKLELYTSLEKETNILHVLFSETEYIKPIANKAIQSPTGGYYPETVTRKNFDKWLRKNKATLDDFLDYQIPVEIMGE